MRRLFTTLAGMAILAAGTPAMADHHAGDRHAGDHHAGDHHAGDHHAGERVGDSMASVLGHDRRAGDRARDEFRNPAETLAFFGIEPGMKVVDFMPSGGWYSRVLIPYLGSEGTYVGLNPAIDADATGFLAGLRGLAQSLPGEAQGWTGGEGAQVVGANAGDDLESHYGTVDRFLIFREMHNIMRFGWLGDTLVTARRLLSDDGMLGIVQHRARPDASADYVLGDNGYLREDDVVALMQAYGFELVDKSDINANPSDPANWEDGVWSLPPGFRGAPEGSEERARRAAIGESDRMTLLFRKRT